MSHTFYDSPEVWRDYGPGNTKYDQLSIDVTHESVWFFGYKFDDEAKTAVIVLPLDELPQIAKAINDFLAVSP